MFDIKVDGIHMTAQPDRSLFCTSGESGRRRTVEVMLEVCACAHPLDVTNSPSSSKKAII